MAMFSLRKQRDELKNTAWNMIDKKKHPEKARHGKLAGAANGSGENVGSRLHWLTLTSFTVGRRQGNRRSRGQGH